MYEIALCDDDSVFSNKFQKQLADALAAAGAAYHLTLFSNPDDLIAEIECGRIFHLLFLDVLFDEEQGIRSAKYLRKKNYPTDIIFITSSPEYAVDGYDVMPLHYLIKPIDPEKLAAALNRFYDRHTPRALQITTSKRILHIPLEEILYFEIYGHEIIIHKENKTTETYVGTLKEIETHLPPLTFVRPHRSYLVSLAKISHIARYSLHLSSGENIPISKRLYSQTQAALINYADRQGILF